MVDEAKAIKMWRRKQNKSEKKIHQARISMKSFISFDLDDL